MKKPKAPRIISIAVTTTITVIFWVFFTLYRVLTAKPELSVDPKLLEPVDTTLDTSTLESLNSKVFFEPGEFTPIVTNEPSDDFESETPETEESEEETEFLENEAEQPLEEELSEEELENQDDGV